MSLKKIQETPYGKNVIELKNISLSFGGVKALTEVSFEVKRGEVFAIIGPNGAGKSSMLNVINGFYKPTSGKINFAGQERSQMEPELAAKSGIARTFQNIALFRVIHYRVFRFQWLPAKMLGLSHHYVGSGNFNFLISLKN